LKPQDLPEEVRQIIERHIMSVEELEILRLLERDRDHSFSAEDIANELRTNPKSAARRIERVRELGLAAEDQDVPGRFRFAPAGTSGEKMAVELLAAYRRLPVTVITMIYSKPSSAIHDFADAFQLKKERDA
jgi:hypothetical protein